MAATSRIRCWLTATVCSAFALAIAPTLPASEDAPADLPDVLAEQDVLFLAPGAPVVIRIRCHFDAADVARSRQSLAATLVNLLDADRDGLLDADEARNVPAYGRFGETRRVGDEWSRLDGAPQDGSVSQDEVAAHIGAATPVRIQLAAAVSARARILDLRRRLDRDGDGLVLPEELRSADEVLRMCDFDDDGAFSLVELEALSQAATPDPDATSALAALLPFVPVHAISPEKLAELLTRIYPAASPPDLPVRGEPAYELNVYFDGRPTNVIHWTKIPRNGEPPAEPQRSRRRSDPFTVDVSGAQIELNWMNADVVVDVMRNIPAGRFGAADGNRNKYVEPSEFAGLDLPGRDFDEVDFDGNGEVVQAELGAFVEQELLLSRFRVSASVGKEAESLFEKLDVIQDRRLTPRELLAPEGDIALSTADESEAVSAEGAVERNRMTFVQTFPRLSSDLGEVEKRPGRSAGRKPVITARTEGPLWFRKMDRNQDGDVTWREFLGSPDAFARLDANGDTLIDANEAGASSPMGR